MIESPTPDAVTGVTRAVAVPALPSPSTNSTALMPRIARTLIAVATFCTIALPRVPRTLITIMITIKATANTFFCMALIGMNCVM